MSRSLALAQCVIVCFYSFFFFDFPAASSFHRPHPLALVLQANVRHRIVIVRNRFSKTHAPNDHEEFDSSHRPIELTLRCVEWRVACAMCMETQAAAKQRRTRNAKRGCVCSRTKEERDSTTQCTIAHCCRVHCRCVQLSIRWPPSAAPLSHARSNDRAAGRHWLARLERRDACDRWIHFL